MLSPLLPSRPVKATLRFHEWLASTRLPFHPRVHLPHPPLSALLHSSDLRAEQALRKGTNRPSSGISSLLPPRTVTSSDCGTSSPPTRPPKVVKSVQAPSPSRIRLRRTPAARLSTTPLSEVTSRSCSGSLRRRERCRNWRTAKERRLCTKRRTGDISTSQGSWCRGGLMSMLRMQTDGRFVPPFSLLSFPSFLSSSERVLRAKSDIHTTRRLFTTPPLVAGSTWLPFSSLPALPSTSPRSGPILRS
jgi:hypothetical protein